MPQGVSQSRCQTRTVAATVQEKRAEKRKCLLTSGCLEGRDASKHASLKVPNQDSCSNNMIHAGRKEERCAHIWVF